MVDPDFDRNVFVNCPFDSDYEPILQAILFCLVRFGLRPRIATERSNAAEPRIEKIRELIQTSRYSIHDLSRCQASQEGEHYRLNMPFELGMDFGCRQYGGFPFSGKILLILEEEHYRYQAAISDLAGSDIQSHAGNHQTAVRKVRNWLATSFGEIKSVPASTVLAEYEDFLKWHYERQLDRGFSDLDIQDYPTPELLESMYEWVTLGKPRD